MKEVKLLSKGLFEKPIMDSKVTTLTITRREKVWGHLIGPLGMIFVVNTIAALVEKFFTQQVGAMCVGLDEATATTLLGVMSKRYELVMTIAKILAVGMGLLNGWLIQNTKSKQGRMRPWYLIFGFVTIIIGMLIFLFSPNTMGESYWYYFFILVVCYNVIGCTYFYLFRDTIVSLTTRDPQEKMQVKFIRQLCWTLISGIIIGLLVGSVVLPMWLDHDLTGYPILMVALSICAIPLLLLEYYYTKERVIDDVVEEVGIDKENKIPLGQQLKALLTNKYFVILTVLATLGGIVDNFKGGNVQYFYIKFLLGGQDNWGMYTLYQVIAGMPLGIGAFAIYPLAKKFGIKNVTVVGYAMVLVGSIVGWMFPSNIPVVLAAGFLRNVGWLPNAYIFATLICYAFDSIEFKSKLRLEGLLGVAIIGAIQCAIYAPFAGGYESAILSKGFIDAEGVVVNESVKSFMAMSFYLFDLILATAYVILLPFMDVEKKMPDISRVLLQRKKEAVLAQGKEWVEPEEQERREKEEFARIHEENRIHDLKVVCEKRGLNFDTENNKYLAQKAENDRKAAEKKAKKEAKAAAKQAKK